MVKTVYDYLDPVPGLMLDADTRVASCYEMWTARGQLADVARGAMATIDVCAV